MAVMWTAVMCCLKLIDDRRMDQGVDVSWKASVLWAGKPVCCGLESRCAVSWKAGVRRLQSEQSKSAPSGITSPTVVLIIIV